MIQHSENLNEIAAGLVKAQSAGLVAVSNRENSHTRSRYADLVDVFNAVRTKLAENGISISQHPGVMRMDGNTALLSLTTVLLHVSGQYLRSTMEMPVALQHKMLNPAQCFGVVLAYARRYALVSVVGVAVGDDRDAQDAFDQAQELEKKSALEKWKAHKAEQPIEETEPTISAEEMALHDLRESIQDVRDAERLTLAVKEYAQNPAKDSATGVLVRDAINARAKELGFKWNKETKQFA